MFSSSESFEMSAPAKISSCQYPLADLEVKNLGDSPPSLDEQQSGRFDYGKSRLLWEASSDIGPEEAEKSENQDAVGIFLCDDSERGLHPFLIVTLADGVSDSPWSKEGARFAIRSAIMDVTRRLLEAERFHDQPKQFFQEVFEEAVKNIEERMRKEFEKIRNDFDKQKLSWAIPTGWKDWAVRRRLKEKNAFCTTLLISVVFAAQMDKKRINWKAAHAVVGDGGLTIWRQFFDSKYPHALGAGEIVDGITSTDDTMLSHYLSPQVRTLPQCFYSDNLGEHFAILLSTDGIVRNRPLRDIINGPLRERIKADLEKRHDTFLPKVIRIKGGNYRGATEDNLANKIIEEIKNSPDATKFLDNLTLAIISCY